ncbi:YggS family pyridoxal phosphate-dependent enzyme, partial [bacterium]|nr:YggS family pyridoxal phosphate-dependent enzyme [bacterium]
MAIVHENLIHIRQQIAAACLRSGRAVQEVELVAVTKTVPTSRIREAIDAGVRVIGENRVQEAADKAKELDREVVWHLVGHLQSNKVKRACEIFSVIESVDSLQVAKEIDTRAGQLGRTIEVLLEVNTSGEPSKYGVAPENTVL